MNMKVPNYLDTTPPKVLLPEGSFYVNIRDNEKSHYFLPHFHFPYLFFVVPRAGRILYRDRRSDRGGGGMIRHYFNTEKGRISTRYSYEGIKDNIVYVKKNTRSNHDRSVQTELIKVPLTSSMCRKRGTMTLGSKQIPLQPDRYGRIPLKEMRRK